MAVMSCLSCAWVSLLFGPCCVKTTCTALSCNTVQDVADMRAFLEEAGLKHTSVLAKVRAACLWVMCTAWVQRRHWHLLGQCMCSLCCQLVSSA